MKSPTSTTTTGGERWRKLVVTEFRRPNSPWGGTTPCPIVGSGWAREQWAAAQRAAGEALRRFGGSGGLEGSPRQSAEVKLGPRQRGRAAIGRRPAHPIVPEEQARRHHDDAADEEPDAEAFDNGTTPSASRRSPSS